MHEQSMNADNADCSANYIYLFPCGRAELVLRVIVIVLHIPDNKYKMYIGLM